MATPHNAPSEAAPPAQQCEVHPDVPTWRTDGFGPLAKKTPIGCWRCHLARAKDGPPEKQGSARGELAATLARVKGKPLRETAVAEALTILVKELRQAQGERDALKKRVEALALENREVGAKWQGAVARGKELEVTVEKLEAQLDRTMGVMDELEGEKDAAGAKVAKLEAQVKQAEKERDALKADVKDLAARMKELESQLQAFAEQKRLSSMARIREEISNALVPTPAPAPAPAPPNTKHSSSGGGGGGGGFLVAFTTTAAKEQLQQQQPQLGSSQAGGKPATMMTTATTTTTSKPPATPFSPVLDNSSGSSNTGVDDMDPYADPTAAISAAPAPVASAAPLQQEEEEKGEGAEEEQPSQPPPQSHEQGQEQAEQGSEQPAQQQQQPAAAAAAAAAPARKRTSIVGFGNVFKGLVSNNKGAKEGKDGKEAVEEAAGVGGATAAGSSPNKAPGGKQKINLVVHMQGGHRVNFTTFTTDRFEKVMVRYLQVKKIEAPLEETRFVVDGCHHTLAPELTPVDFGLHDGATINVVVPEEYLNPQQEAAKGEEAAGEPEVAVAAAAVEAL